MALIDIKFFSDCLKRRASVRVILPNDEVTDGNFCYSRPPKTLYLLHGYTGIGEEWIWNSAVTAYASRYNLCIVLPDGENSFYLDGPETGRKYATYVGQELPCYIQRTFSLSAKREDNFVGGFSMGGFGAIHTALAFPERFGKLFALSSALITHEVEQMLPGSDNGTANYEYYRLTFGDPGRLAESENNPEELVRRIRRAKGTMPEIFMACGTEDFLLQENRQFAAFLKEQGVDFIYRESGGGHDFTFWNQYLEPAVRWLADVQEQAAH